MHEGNFLQKAAKKSKIGIGGLSKALGLSRSNLYYHFSRDELSDDIKERAAAALGTTVAELFGTINTAKLSKEDILQLYRQVSDSTDNIVPGSYDKILNGYTAVPLIPVYAYAGYLSGYGDAIYLEDLPVYYTEKLRDEDKYRAFEVRGDSMDDGTFMSILEGYQVLGKRVDIDAANEKIPTQREYIIVHKEHGILLKEIVEHDIERGRIKCASYNSKYQDLKLNLSDLVELYYVKEIKIKKP